MRGWFSETLSLEKTQIHYYRTGGEKPTIILSHGAMDDGLCWTPVAKALEPDYDVIMVDCRGHGLSENAQGDYSLKARSADLAGLIRALNLKRPVLMGHSLGAESSLYTAVHFPDLIGGIILEDPPIVLPGESIFGGEVDVAKMGTMIVWVMRLFKVLPRFLAKPLARRMNPGWSDEEIAPWVGSKRRLSGDFVSSLKEMTIPSLDFSIFERVSCPGMMIIGDREKGSIVSLAAAKEAQKYRPALWVTQLAGASHNIRRDRLGSYLKAVRDFLTEIPV